MDIIEAYDRTLAAAEELHASGVELCIDPSKSDSIEVTDQLPRQMWVNINFFPKNKGQVCAITNQANKLGELGITFDAGGSVGNREWSIDWSFRVHDGPDREWEVARTEMEDMISRSALKGALHGSKMVYRSKCNKCFGAAKGLGMTYTSDPDARGRWATHFHTLGGRLAVRVMALEA